MASILVYALASAACGFSHTIPQLRRFRFVLGLGMGGEWTTGAALIAETWRAEHRGKALGFMQSAYAIGEAIAALSRRRSYCHTLAGAPVFFVGVLPAFLVFWIQAKSAGARIVEKARGTATKRYLCTNSWRKEFCATESWPRR